MTKKMKLNSVLSQSAFWIINKKMYRKIGLEPTLLLQHFYDLESNVFNGEFFQQQDRIREEFGWSRSKVENCITILVGSGFLNVTPKGLPRKNYYSLDHVNIANFLFIEELQHARKLADKDDSNLAGI